MKMKTLDFCDEFFTKVEDKEGPVDILLINGTVITNIINATLIVKRNDEIDEVILYGHNLENEDEPEVEIVVRVDQIKEIR